MIRIFEFVDAPCIIFQLHIPINIKLYDCWMKKTVKYKKTGILIPYGYYSICLKDCVHKKISVYTSAWSWMWEFKYIANTMLNGFRNIDKWNMCEHAILHLNLRYVEPPYSQSYRCVCTFYNHVQMVLKIAIEAFFIASMEIPDNITRCILVHIVLPHVGIKDHLCYLKEMQE